MCDTPVNHELDEPAPLWWALFAPAVIVATLTFITVVAYLGR